MCEAWQKRAVAIALSFARTFSARSRHSFARSPNRRSESRANFTALPSHAIRLCRLDIARSPWRRARQTKLVSAGWGANLSKIAHKQQFPRDPLKPTFDQPPFTSRRRFTECQVVRSRSSFETCGDQCGGPTGAPLESSSEPKASRSRNRWKALGCRGLIVQNNAQQRAMDL